VSAQQCSCDILRHTLFDDEHADYCDVFAHDDDDGDDDDDDDDYGDDDDDDDYYIHSFQGRGVGDLTRPSPKK